MHSQYARSYLDGAGLRRTKSIICEYNTSRQSGSYPALREGYAAELGIALINGQKSSCDMMMYSSSDAYSVENGLYAIDDRRSVHRYAAFNVMRAYGRLYKLGAAYDVGGDYRKELYSLAARGKDEGAIMLVARAYSGRVEIALKDCPFKTCSVIKTVPGGERGEGRVFRAERIAINGSKIILPVKENEIFEISLTDMTENEPQNPDLQEAE
jgi:hypothetical protein